MTERFKFFETPRIPQEIIIKQMETDAVFALSVFSPNAKETIRQMKWKITGTLVDFEECRGKTKIQCKNLGLSEKTVTWELGRNENDEKIPTLKINDLEFAFNDLDRNAPNTEQWTNQDYQAWFVRTALKYFCDLFGPVWDVAAAMRVRQMYNVPNMRLLKHCILTDGRATSVDAERFFEQFHGRTMILHPVIDGHISVGTNLMNVPHLYIRNAQWFNREHLLRFTGKNLFLCDATLETNDVIRYVEQWLRSSNRRIKSVVIRLEDGFTFNEGVIRQNFHRAMQWNPEKRAQDYVYYDDWKLGFFRADIHLLDCSQGLDFERENDGLLCTLRMSQTAFCFYVWHNRFPKPRVIHRNL